MRREKQQIGSYIRWLRKGRGYTLRELAEKISVNHSYLSRIETNQVAPSEETLKKLAVALNAPHLFVIAGRTVPPDIDENKQNINEMLDAIQKGTIQETFEEEEKERVKYPSDDPFRNTIPDHPNIFPKEQDWFDTFSFLGLPHEWIFLPPPIRTELINAFLKWRDESSKLLLLEQDFKNKGLLLSDNDFFALTTTAENAGFHKGFEMGLIEAFQILQNQFKENPLWFFAFFFPPVEARLLTSFYELFVNIETSHITLDKNVLYTLINAFANFLKDSQFNKNSDQTGD